MSYSEVKQLPTAYRQWFLERLVKEFSQKNEIDNGKEDINNDNINKLKQYENMLSNKT